MSAPVGFESHDHHCCIEDAVERAEATCAARGLRFTPIRKRVLEILLEQHRALGAYDVLEVLREEGHKPQPPVAYRALDFLVANGFAHRVERLNGFVACAHPGTEHDPAFLICRGCESVAEAQAEPKRGELGKTAREAGFQIERSVLEVEGLCPGCQEANP